MNKKEARRRIYAICRVVNQMDIDNLRASREGIANYMVVREFGRPLPSIGWEHTENGQLSRFRWYKWSTEDYLGTPFSNEKWGLPDDMFPFEEAWKTKREEAIEYVRANYCANCANYGACSHAACFDRQVAEELSEE